MPPTLTPLRGLSKSPHVLQPRLFVITRAASVPPSARAVRFFHRQRSDCHSPAMDPLTDPKKPRRFAPLGAAGAERDGAAVPAPKLVGVVFDVDGTLCLPQNYMFAEMRAALGIQKPTDILDHIYSLPEGAPQTEAMDKIRDIERRAMRNQQPQRGLVELMDYLDQRGVRKGICTRNFETPVSHLLTTFLPATKFHPIITRDFRPPKPDPAGILHIASQWSVSPTPFPAPSRFDAESEPTADSDGTAPMAGLLPLIMVGDSIDDMTAGHRAGAATVLLVNEANAELATHEHTDLCIKRLDDLIGVLEKGFVGQIGQGDEEPDTKAQAEEALRR
ncbi:HAD-like domain-containing protein [Lineolata rhizophorae]|uniref:HAD-like domain-containing protein n=1 Tax=Lineolata rhizophorae TaxID=578093 RepID=A0A6A6P3B3_9PEZI|nr:HAD-like domain-containing protein [Lineolata rhizophorae]